MLSPKVLWCLSLAEQGHKGVKRDSGKDYLEEHIYPITLEVLKYPCEYSKLENRVILCLLHDVIEDCKSINLDIVKNKLGEKIFKQLLILSKPQKDKDLTLEEKYIRTKEYVEKISNASESVRIVKIIDRLNNLMCSEFHRNKEKYLRYIKESIDFYIPLAMVTDSYICKSMIREVERLSESMT